MNYYCYTENWPVSRKSIRFIGLCQQETTLSVGDKGPQHSLWLPEVDKFYCELVSMREVLTSRNPQGQQQGMHGTTQSSVYECDSQVAVLKQINIIVSNVTMNVMELDKFNFHLFSK